MPGPRWNGVEAGSRPTERFQPPSRLEIWVPAFAGMSGWIAADYFTTPPRSNVPAGPGKTTGLSKPSLPMALTPKNQS